MSLFTVLSTLMLAGLLGSVLLLVASSFRLAFHRYRALIKPATVGERRLAWAAAIAAVLGSVALFIIPAYIVSDCSSSVSITSFPSSSPNVTPLASSCFERRDTFMQVNGPQVISLFTIPVLFALLPLALLRLRFRGPLFAMCAFLLAGQAAIGMSGHGLAFAPSSILLVLAGFLGTFYRGAQPSASTDASSPLREGRG